MCRAPRSKPLYSSAASDGYKGPLQSGGDMAGGPPPTRYQEVIIPPAAPAVAAPRQLSRSRSRSPAHSVAAACGDEEEMGYFRLNVIEATPDSPRLRLPQPGAAQTCESPRCQGFEAAQRRSSGPVVQAGLQGSGSGGGPVVQVQQLYPGSAAAAASRVCAQMFGRSSSIFHHGAAMSYLLRGSAADVDVVQAMVQGLPRALQFAAEDALRQLARVRGLKLTGLTLITI